jgi:hypothetical protein
MKIDPTYNPINEEFGDEYHYAQAQAMMQDEDLLSYDLTNEGNEDAYLDAAYEDRYDMGYEPEWEY